MKYKKWSCLWVLFIRGIFERPVRETGFHIWRPISKYSRDWHCSRRTQIRYNSLQLLCRKTRVSRLSWLSQLSRCDKVNVADDTRRRTYSADRVRVGRKAVEPNENMVRYVLAKRKEMKDSNVVCADYNDFRE